MAGLRGGGLVSARVRLGFIYRTFTTRTQAGTLTRMNLSNITAVISDVDGVLTDGRIGLGPGPEAIRFFDMRDGMGTRLLIDAGVPVAWLSRLTR